jgi:hypothetical protein
MNEFRERIQVQKDIIRDAELNIEKIIAPFVEEFAWVYRVPNIWDCEKSPIGTCIYNKFEDPAMDGCIFCHEPYERK